MKEFNSFDKKKCKKIILDSVRDDKVILKNTFLFGSMIIGFGFLFLLADVFNKKSTDPLSERIFILFAIIPIGYLVFFGLIGSLVVFTFRDVVRRYYKHFVYDKFAIDETTNKIVFQTKKPFEIDISSIESISYLTNNEKLILAKVQLSFAKIKVDILKIKTTNKDCHIVVDTIQNSEEFIETLNSIKEIERPSENNK